MYLPGTAEEQGGAREQRSRAEGGSMEITDPGRSGAGRFRTVVALGFFDGVHAGHAALLRRVVTEAAERHAEPAVFSFYDGEGIKSDVPRLTTQEERLRLLEEAGIARAFLGHFGAMRTLSPEAFAEQVLCGICGACAAVCGPNFRFGYGGQAGPERLSACLATHGIPLFVLPAQEYHGKMISASAIRAAVEQGDMPQAAGMLGRPFTLSGPVLHGHALGRRLGFPTANQSFPAGTVIPAYGVYAVRVALSDEDRIYRGIANVGRRPTVEDAGAVNCETHLLDYTGDLYGRQMRVFFLRHLRGERKFADTEELRRTVLADMAAAERMHVWENGPN